MKFRFILTFVLLVGSAPTRGYPLDEPELSPASEYSEQEVKREKRTLTTICVEIKPTSPYEEPYFMCKGTDTTPPSKGSSYSGSGSQSPSPSYKPKPSYGESEPYQSGLKGGYPAPTKISHQPEHTKYGPAMPYESPSRPAYGKKPPSSNPASHSSYSSSYESPKPSYGVKQYDSHDSQNDYPKPSSHSSAYSSPHKPHDYRPSTYSSSDPVEYSKPSSYGPSTSYNQKPAHGDSYSKGTQTAPQSSSYDDKYPGTSSYSSKPSTSSYSSKPSTSSYSSKPTSYEHTDHGGYNQYNQGGAQSPQKSYSKSTYSPPPSYHKPDYHTDHPKPSKPDYSQPPSKPSYSSSHQAYRSEDMMPPMWDSQQEVENSQVLGHPMEYYGMDTPRSMEQDPQQQYEPSPVHMDYAGYEQSGPQLQAAPPMPAPAYEPYIEPIQYSPAIPTYQPAVPAAVAAPQYGSPAPTYTPYIPVSYPPAPISYSQPMSIQAYPQPIHLLKPSCPQSYFYSLQPTIVSLPCFSSQAAATSIGAAPQFYRTSINPLQDAPEGRSSTSDTDKTTASNSTAVESEDMDRPKPQTEKESTPKQEVAAKSAEVTSEKLADKTDQTVAMDNPKQDQTSAVTKGPEDGDTKVAYQAMIKMAKLAAQLKKDPDE